MKRLSIIVPLYNSEAYLPKCLSSLLSQDIPHEEYEIILVNDGSPDGSEALAKDYATKYTNIVVLSQENKGTSGARNTGLRHATGKYVYFVDPDDCILENSLKDVLDRMDEESLDVLRFGYTEVDEQYRPTKSCKHPESPDYSPCMMDGPTFMAERLGIACYVWTFIFRLSIIKDNGLYFIEGDYYDDTPWLPRVLMKAERVDSMDVKRHFYLIRNNSLVQSRSEKSIQKKIDGQEFLIKELLRQKHECHDHKAGCWYDRMINHCIVTLLTMVGMYRYDSRDRYIGFLQDEGLLPLSFAKGFSNGTVKRILISYIPGLFCYLIHLKNAR